jgi:uncharacterized protein
MTNIEFIKTGVSAPVKSIEVTLQLLAEDCTIPFIARYRKDRTGNLDEVVIEQIEKLNGSFEAIIKRKEGILKSIQEQNALTPELQQKISASFDLTELEDMYLPYKKKKKTKADTARENGLEPLAKIIMAQNADDVDFNAAKYLNANIANEAEALQGARDIIAEWINENVYIRKSLRKIYSRKAAITTKITKAAAANEKAKKFEQYFDWSENLTNTACRKRGIYKI